MRTNQRMNETVLRMVDRFACSVPASVDLVLQSGTQEEAGAVVFSRLRELASSVQATSFPDVTGFECCVNHLHIDEYVDSGHPEDYLCTALRVVSRLAEGLRRDSRYGDFRFIVSLDSDSCSVRFHKIRNREVWLASDLESYALDAVLEIDVAVPARPR